MPEIKDAPIRWLVVGVAMILISIAVITASAIGYGVKVRQSDQEHEIITQAAQVKVLQAELAAARKREFDRVFAQCVAGREAAIKATPFIDTFRDILDGLAIATADQLDRDRMNGASASVIESRRQSLARWRRLRAGVPTFKIPTCTRTQGPTGAETP